MTSNDRSTLVSRELRLHLWIASLALVVCAPSRGWAIEFENGINHLTGVVVKDDGKKLTVRLSDGKDYEYERFRIKIVHELDRKRLEKLSPETPKAYRDYAEELAKHPTDPEAKDTALRLYLIAAFLSPEQFGTSSLLAMSALAENPAEARRYIAMAYLLDTKNDRSILKRDPAAHLVPKGKAAGDANASLDAFQKALRSFRTGKMKDAKAQSVLAGDKLFDNAPGLISRKAFEEICDSAKCGSCEMKKLTCSVCNGKKVELNQFGVLQRCSSCGGTGTIVCKTCDGTGVDQSVIENHAGVLIQAELWAIDQMRGGKAGNPVGEASSGGWGATFQSRQLERVPVLSLETISHHNPRMNVFRDFIWKTP